MYLHPKLKTILLYLFAKNRDSLNETTLNQTNQTVVCNPYVATDNCITLKQLSSIPIYAKQPCNLDQEQLIERPRDITNLVL